MINTVVHSPGRRFFNPMEMRCRRARGRGDPSTDEPRERLHPYYTRAMIGLARPDAAYPLDLTLDDSMRAFSRARPDRDSLHDGDAPTLAEVTGDAAFADDFFRRHIEGSDVVDYEALLARAGILLRRANPGQATLGQAQYQFQGGAATVASPTLIGTPLYEAGIDRGDRILSLEGRPLDSARTLAEILAGHRPGDTVEIVYEQRGATRPARLTLAADPRLEAVPFEAAGRPLDAETLRFREAWLGAKRTVTASR